jgi:hypothetical protein
MTAATEAGKAAELIAFALQPRLARGADERYGELWSEYRTDEEFHNVVDAVANGLGLVVIDATEQGLVVAPMDKSPFAFRLTDYAAGLTPKRRMLIGLAHLGIAAVAYPRESDLEDDIVVRRSVEQVERFLRDACQALADAEEQDSVVRDDEETLAWREYLSMPASRRMAKGGYSADCTVGQISRAFDWLVAQGMARQSGDSYQLLDRYRVQVRELAGHVALERLRAANDASDIGGAAEGAASRATTEDVVTEETDIYADHAAAPEGVS